MRVLILLIVIIVALVIVQHERNDCKWGEPSWMECIMTVGEVSVPDVDVDVDSSSDADNEAEPGPKDQGPDVSP
ncbi:hypothetical protein A7A08_00525 [Methyloligella halotolerans]|uniref:Uncharacterized protein n=1 Tax=Methyloligella halotolerans TaxID=1177755 RepID=A0A1E2S2F4_9HYPH|nr:hypothetical protein [Methyloligella halotolerans]ODA68693.1 hypothetical protein A7A08_00525 [Methyloligella halotolerans]